VQSESNGCWSSSHLGKSSNVLADSYNSGSGQDQLLSKLRTTGIEQSSRCSRLSGESTKTRKVTVWPSRPRQPQYEWEPSRVVGNTDCGRQPLSFDSRSSSETISRGENIIEQTECRQAQPSMGGDTNGSASRVDYAELCVTCDNRTDELRLLGNGVVPDTATRAFLTLVEELNESPSLSTSSR
jgi:hypothetical protein